MGALEENPIGIDGVEHAPPRIGLIAGSGRYPILIAEALKRQACRVYCLGVLGQADPRLAEICDDFRLNGLGKFGWAIRYFKSRGVTDATMAGKVNKQFVFQPWIIPRHLPDWCTIRAFLPHFLTGKRDNKDDTLLGRVIDLFAANGIRLGPATDYAPELLVKQGHLTRRGPSTKQLKDIQFGWKLAKAMGRLDVGQSVVVKNLAALAVEAVEGTDQCIRRAGRLCPAGEFTVVKVAKPQQDMRFDVPTVGLDTLKSIVAAGGRVLAVEAERTILLDQADVIEFANRNKLVIVALESPASELAERQTPAA